MGKCIMIFCLLSVIFSIVCIFVALSINHLELLTALSLSTLVNLILFEIVRLEEKKRKGKVQ